MQTRDQWKGSRNWKVVTGVATAATLGLGAIAVASPGSSDVPQPIDLSDRAVVVDGSLLPTQDTFVAFDDVSPDSSPSVSGAQTGVLADSSPQDSPDASPSVSGAQTDLQDSPDLSPQDSPDASPQASIDDSPDVQGTDVDDSPDVSVDGQADDTADDSADATD